MSTDSTAKPPEGLRDLEQIDAVFSALAHPTRRHILQVLAARGGTLTAGELSFRFAHSWPTTTRHLGVLLDAGVVSVASEGRQRHYHIERQQTGRRSRPLAAEHRFRAPAGSGSLVIERGRCPT